MITVDVLDNKYDNMAKEICEVKESIKGLGTSIAVNHKMVMDKFDGLDTKYATKSSVNRIWVIIWSIIGFFAAAGGTMLIQKVLSE